MTSVHDDEMTERKTDPFMEKEAAGDKRIEDKLHALVHSWGLSRFSEGMAMQWLTKSLGGLQAEDHFERLRKWILMQLNHQRLPEGVSQWQRGCPEVIPSLRAKPVWDCGMFPWIPALEHAFPIIKEELLALRHKQGFQPYRAPTWASNISVRLSLSLSLCSRSRKRGLLAYNCVC